MRLLATLGTVSLFAAALAWSTPADACARHCGEGKFRGTKITIDLQDAEIANVLRLIGDVSGKNLVFGDEVKGKITLKLKNVPWDQALDAILKTKGFGMEEDDNIIRVTLQSRLDEEEEQALNLEAKRQLQGPLTTRVIPLNFTPAKEMVEMVKPLLSPRGTVTVDERTNTLIIRDVRTSGALRL